MTKSCDTPLIILKTYDLKNQFGPKTHNTIRVYKSDFERFHSFLFIKYS